MRRPLFLLALLIGCWVALPSARGDKFGVSIGDRAPVIEPLVFHNCVPWPAQPRERLVRLVQVIRTWSSACATQMAQMDALHDQFGERGVLVVSITNEHPDVVEKFVQQQAPRHPVVVEKTDSARSFGLLTGVPTAYLIDVDGNLLWKGNWAQDCSRLLPPLLRTVRLRPRMPLRWSALDSALQRQRYGQAMRHLVAAEAGKTSAAEKAALQAARSWIQMVGMEVLAEADVPVQDGRFYESWVALDGIERRFAGCDVEKQAKRRVLKLLSVSERAQDVKAGRAYYDALLTLPQSTPQKSAEKLKRAMFWHRESRFWRLAEEQIQELEARDGGG